VRVQLPSGAIANVSKGVKPETLMALDEMMRLVAKQFAERNQDRTGSERGGAGTSDQPFTQQGGWSRLVKR
jgi:hypothetical protein